MAEEKRFFFGFPEKEPIGHREKERGKKQKKNSSILLINIEGVLV